MQVGKELKASAIVGIDVGVADLAIEGVIGDHQVDAEDVVSAFRGVLLLGVVLTVVLLEGILEGSLDVHHLDYNSHLVLVIVCIRQELPLAMSSLSVSLLSFLRLSTVLSNFARLIFLTLDSLGTNLSHSLESNDLIQGWISRK